MSIPNKCCNIKFVKQTSFVSCRVCAIKFVLSVFSFLFLRRFNIKQVICSLMKFNDDTGFDGNWIRIGVRHYRILFTSIIDIVYEDDKKKCMNTIIERVDVPVSTRPCFMWILSFWPPYYVRKTGYKNGKYSRRIKLRWMKRHRLSIKRKKQ